LITNSYLVGACTGRSAGFSLEDAIDICRGKPKQIALLTSVGQQATEFREEAPWIDGRYAVASSQQDQLGAMVVQKSIRHHYQAGTGPTHLSGNDGFEL
jgi:hypothetical protein